MGYSGPWYKPVGLTKIEKMILLGGETKITLREDAPNYVETARAACAHREVDGLDPRYKVCIFGCGLAYEKEK